MSTLARLLAPSLGLCITGTALAGSHSWRFNEVFSSADGMVQFIELKEAFGANNEIFIANKWVRSDATGNEYVFPANLGCCTADKHLLLATPAFAALPGAPAPDYILPPEAFFEITGDTLRYWTYDDWTFGAVPTDGTTSLRRDGSTGANTPTNFAGATGTVTVPCHPADVDGNGAVDADDLVAVILAWGKNPGDPADIDGDGDVDVDDLLAVILAWGPC